jgi:hypothetical protein
MTSLAPPAREIRRARKLLSQRMPRDAWLRAAPRTLKAIELMEFVRRGLEYIASYPLPGEKPRGT